MANRGGGVNHPVDGEQGMEALRRGHDRARNVRRAAVRNLKEQPDDRAMKFGQKFEEFSVCFDAPGFQANRYRDDGRGGARDRIRGQPIGRPIPANPRRFYNQVDYFEEFDDDYHEYLDYGRYQFQQYHCRRPSQGSRYTTKSIRLPEDEDDAQSYQLKFKQNYRCRQGQRALYTTESIKLPEEERDVPYQLFRTRCKVNNYRLDVIIDGDSCENMITKNSVEQLKLPVERLLEPFTKSWIKSGVKIAVTHRCKVKFSLGPYIGEVYCDVVDIDACQLQLGRPWLDSVDAKYLEHDNVYKIRDGRVRYTLLPLKNRFKAAEENKTSSMTESTPKLEDILKDPDRDKLNDEKKEVVSSVGSTNSKSGDHEKVALAREFTFNHKCTLEAEKNEDDETYKKEDGIITVSDLDVQTNVDTLEQHSEEAVDLRPILQTSDEDLKPQKPVVSDSIYAEKSLAELEEVHLQPCTVYGVMEFQEIQNPPNRDCCFIVPDYKTCPLRNDLYNFMSSNTVCIDEKSYWQESMNFARMRSRCSKGREAYGHANTLKLILSVPRKKIRKKVMHKKYSVVPFFNHKELRYFEFSISSRTSFSKEGENDTGSYKPKFKKPKLRKLKPK